MPPSEPSSWEDAIPLARVFPADGSAPARIVLYRRPIAERCQDHDELASVVEAVVREQVAGLLGRDPEDLEEDR